MSRAGVVLALALALAWVYAEVPSHEFLRYDDDLYVVENPTVRAPLAAAVRDAFTAPYDTNWIPLTTLSWRLDYAWHGLPCFSPRDLGGIQAFRDPGLVLIQHFEDRLVQREPQEDEKHGKVRDLGDELGQV